MPRVICDLPNASAEISGVKFHKLDDGGLISDEISQEQAELFASIPGYTIDEDGVEPVKAEVKPAPTARKGGGKKVAAEQPPAAEPQPEPTAAPAAEPTAATGATAGENEEVF